MPLPDDIRCIVVDIEGTTTPISFVYDVLFPFAAAGLPEWFANVQDGTPAADALARLRSEYEGEAAAADLPEFGNGTAYARFLMAEDRKSTGLKAIQGLIWRAGYESGALRGQVFPDVPDALRSWSDAGLRLRVFSSGSVLAQTLLFGNTDYGDLTRYFEAYHDTNVGPKKEASSYTAIAEAASLPPSSMLFLSDVMDELDAAARAGMATGLLRRPGNAPVESDRHPSYVSFTELV